MKAASTEPTTAYCAVWAMLPPKTSFAWSGSQSPALRSEAFCCRAVGRELRIGEGDAGDAGVLQRRDSIPRGVEAEAPLHPQHEPAPGVGEHGESVPALHRLGGIGHVRGEEEVEGRALLDLGRQASARAVADLDLLAWVGGFEARGDFIQRSVKARGGGDTDGLGGQGRAEERAKEREEQEQGTKHGIHGDLSSGRWPSARIWKGPG